MRSRSGKYAVRSFLLETPATCMRGRAKRRRSRSALVGKTRNRHRHHSTGDWLSLPRHGCLLQLNHGPDASFPPIPYFDSSVPDAASLTRCFSPDPFLAPITTALNRCSISLFLLAVVWWYYRVGISDLTTWRYSWSVLV
ncbi:hypothetical protein BDV26DRAFT_169955 [Aspergillus bertholletiae]|uniref:Uncharacterized protein n=1 Tax=Aspergillus bertholletiae TaxID=1226010 RepID=A0A5N7BC61_9EURO|nr:hypothetical protein BDV26DRAFT_169955 [Aspergillus bertholletiae]